jgi:hypothetical protein
MKDSKQLLSTRTVDLGYEQMLLIEDQDLCVSVLFRGVWLRRSTVPRTRRLSAPET